MCVASCDLIDKISLKMTEQQSKHVAYVITLCNKVVVLTYTIQYYITNEIKVCSKVNVQVANEDNMMQHYIPDVMSVYSPCVKDSSMLGLSNLVKTGHL